jgi:hypothetical protein
LTVLEESHKRYLWDSSILTNSELLQPGKVEGGHYTSARPSSVTRSIARLIERLDLTLNITGIFDRFSPNIFSSEQIDRLVYSHI